MHASTPGFARDAATDPWSKAARPASCAVTPGARRTASNMPRGEPKAVVADAAGQATAVRAVANALSSRPGAINRKMPPVANATLGGERAGVATDCGAPSQGASRCPVCAHRSYMRSGQHRGLPIYPPLFTVVEIATEENHGTFDSWEEVVMCLAFARLSHEEVEIISEQSPMTTCTGY